MTEDTAELTIAGGRDEVRAARRFIDATLVTWGLDEGAMEVTLVASELVTNAVLHARTAITIRVFRHPGRVRVEVHDGSPVMPEWRHYSDLSATGRGLHLVDTVATAWGTEPESGGKTVWCEVATPGSAA